MSALAAKFQINRVSTGIRGLDTVLCGGLVCGGAMIIQGGPGTGKTILANQIAFAWAQRGERVLYVTLLSESHDRMLRHLSAMSFLDSSQIAENVYYESGYRALEREGLDGIMHQLTRDRRGQNASLVVFDGLFLLAEAASSEKDFRKFLNDLSTWADVTGCVVLLLTNTKRESSSPEYTMVDGWLQLNHVMASYRAFRDVRIHKLRGSNFIPGRHFFTISENGLRVYPRLETQFANEAHALPSQDRLSTGVATLDGMTCGGFVRGSTTLLMGPTGVGKTSLGLQFIAESTPEKPGVIFGFYERTSRLVSKAHSLNIELETRLQNKSLHAVWNPPAENLLDELAEQLLDTIQRVGAKRLLLDGVGALEQSAVYPERLNGFLAALTSRVRALGCTAVYTAELPELVGGEAQKHIGTVSALAENIVLLRYNEDQSRPRRTLTIIKMRESDFDSQTRSFVFSANGISVGPPFAHTTLRGSAWNGGELDD